MRIKIKYQIERKLFYEQNGQELLKKNKTMKNKL